MQTYNLGLVLFLFLPSFLIVFWSRKALLLFLNPVCGQKHAGIPLILIRSPSHDPIHRLEQSNVWHGRTSVQNWKLFSCTSLWIIAFTSGDFRISKSLKMSLLDGLNARWAISSSNFKVSISSFELTTLIFIFITVRFQVFCVF